MYHRHRRVVGPLFPFLGTGADDRDMTNTELHQHAVEVDTRIAETYRSWKTAQQKLSWSYTDVRHTAGQRQADYGRGAWNGTFTEAVARCEAQVIETPVTYRNREAGQALNKLTEAQAAADEWETAYYEAEQDYAGWTRFYLVVDGHIHSSLRCSTCYPTTEFGWLPQLSGLTETDAVAEYGAVLCSICYPSAPVEYVGGKSDGLTLAERAARKAERDAEKTARATAKAAKTLDTPQWVRHYTEAETPGRGDRIETVHAAKAWIKGCIDNVIIYDYNWNATEVADGTARLAAELRIKGIDIDTLIAKWTKAAHKAAAR